VQVYRGKTLTNASFRLEEASFIDCQLKDCDLFFSGGDFDWQGTSFDNCRFHWLGPAKSTWLLLQTIGLVKQQQPPAEIPKSSVGKPN
jgi:hypothetical protein